MSTALGLLDSKRLRLPPGYSATVEVDADHVDVNLLAPPRLCVECETRPCRCKALRPIFEEYHGCIDTTDPLLAVLVTYMEDAFHEALEWITVDGVRWASAHPERECYDLVTSSLTRLLVEYRVQAEATP